MTDQARPTGGPPYVCDDNLRRCRISVTLREKVESAPKGYEPSTIVVTGWAEISEDGGWVHFFDDEADEERWATWPRHSINWIDWEAVPA